ncbi:hypothetical protein HK099_001766 [Clydaea vesicula]|uniref:Peptidase S9 prolyl oligopeptidase catalytic domain-containing protein n=1 Tax=Clydaea vesicula TaxID=447962 RepID=A0AAD5TTL9_9FUNG|nr:hypothetical protein HK099_001766 [Clydaea vesicula]
MGHRLPIARLLYKLLKCNIFLLSYRGYGFSEGEPNEVGLKIDAQTALDYIKNHEILKNTKLIAYGQSIGGAVAIDIVSKNENLFEALIIENTFLSIPKLIPTVMPVIAPVKFLCHQKWNNEESIKNLKKIPILLLSGSKDELVPPSHMLELFKILKEVRRCNIKKKDNLLMEDEDLKLVWKEFANGTHNDTCMQDNYFKFIFEFLHNLGIV